MNTTHPIAGILILVLSTWALSTLDASGKWVMAAGISLFFMVWVRYIVHLVLVMTIVIPLKGWRVFKAKQPGMQLLRGVVKIGRASCREREQSSVTSVWIKEENG